MNHPHAKPSVLWRALIGGAVAAVALSTSVAQAQNAGAYPSKPIRLVIPFAPGGSTDILGRLLAQKLGENMQTTVVVDNKPGANGTIGCDLVAKAPADGYTVILGDVGCMSMAPGLYTRLPYDPQRDFAPVSLVARSPLVLTVGAQSPLHSLKDLTAAAQAAPGKLNYPSSGTGGPNHLGAELYAMQAKVKVSHIPYKGMGPMITDLMGGQVEMGASAVAAVQGQIKQGSLRPIGVMGKERVKSLPDVPTIAEQGFPDVDVAGWFAAVGPKGLPPAQVKRLHDALVAAFNDPDVKAGFAQRDDFLILDTPEQSAQFLKSEQERYARLVEKAKVAIN